MKSLADLETLDIWPEPQPLPGGLLPVQAFDTAMLPAPFRPWIEDIAERMQTPAEFIAVPAMIAAGAVIGRKVAMRPMQHDDWQEVPNLTKLLSIDQQPISGIRHTRHFLVRHPSPLRPIDRHLPGPWPA